VSVVWAGYFGSNAEGKAKAADPLQNANGYLAQTRRIIICFVFIVEYKLYNAPAHIYLSSLVQQKK